MIWGRANLGDTIGGNSQWVMGYNEPDQQQITPAQAAADWHDVIEQRFAGKLLLSPAPSQDDLNWLTNFRNAYITAYGHAPRLDAIAVHGYMYDAPAMIAHTQYYINLCQQWPGCQGVWVTEFAFPLPDWDVYHTQRVHNMHVYVDWAKPEPMVMRYAWFAARIHGDETWALQPPRRNSPLIVWDTDSELTGTFGWNYSQLR